MIDKETQLLLKSKANAMYKNPSLMYEYLIRNGSRIPLKKSSMCTSHYLVEVSKKKCFAFPQQDIKIPNKVLKPPPLKILS